MKIAKVLKGTLAAVILAGSLAIAPAANAGVFISVGIAPPPIPVYEQPLAPGYGYIWTPGYWAWGDGGYYWVDGAWVYPRTRTRCGPPATGGGTPVSIIGIRDIGAARLGTTAASTTASATLARASMEAIGTAAISSTTGHTTALASVTMTMIVLYTTSG